MRADCSTFLLFIGVFAAFIAFPVVGKGLKSGHTFFILQDLVDGLCLLSSTGSTLDVAVDGGSDAFGRCDELTHSFTHSLLHSPTHSLFHSLTHSSIHSPTDSLIHTTTKKHSCTHLLTCSYSCIRCGIDAIWYVTGKAGSYQIHARDQDSTEHVDACLSTSVCNEVNSTVTSGSCRSCGAKEWNIVGDTEIGSVITQSNNKYCIRRDGKQAVIDSCDTGYTTFKIEFITKDNILKMNSDGTILSSSLTHEYLTHSHIRHEADQCSY